MHEGTITAQPRAQIFIKRPRLTKLLDDAGGRVLLLVAPAGYGKTTLAREWTAERERVRWYTGGPAMADVAALSVGMAETLEELADPRRPDYVERIRILAARGHDARGLAKAVSACAPGADVLVVVDDYHHAIGSVEAETFFEELLRLTQFRVLITSRERPTWLSARRVVYGEATVVEMGALAFTDDEAREVLGGDSSDQLLTDARGWPAVIGLAAMRGAVEVAADMQPDDLYRFFAEDLFRGASPALRDAMFKLALTGRAGIEGARELIGPLHADLLLEAAERGFIVPGRPQALHPLLRGFLFAKLASLDREAVRDLIVESVRFLAVRRRWDECLFALERFPEKMLILSTLTEAVVDVLDSGRISLVSRWLDLARQQGINDPLTLLLEAEVALRQRNDAGAQALGERAGTMLASDLAARAYLTAARGAHFRDDSAEAAALCERSIAAAVSVTAKFDALWLEFGGAFEHEGANPSRMLARLLTFKGLDASRLLRLQTSKGLLLGDAGRVTDAIEQLKLADALMPGVNDPLTRTNQLQYFAYFQLLQGRYLESLSASARLLDDARDSGLEFAVDVALLRQAGAYVGMRRLGQAQAVIHELEKRSESASHFIVDNLRLQRARVAIAAGDLERAKSLLDVPPTGPSRPAFLGEVIGYRAIVLAGLAKLDAAAQVLRGDERLFSFVESRALRDVAKAILEVAAGRVTTPALASARHLLTAGDADALVTGYRAYAPLAEIGGGRLGTSRPDGKPPLQVRRRWRGTLNWAQDPERDTPSPATVASRTGGV